MDQWTNQDTAELKFSLIQLLDLVMTDYLTEADKKTDETDKKLMVCLFYRYREVLRIYRRASQAGYPLSSFISILSDAMKVVYAAYTGNEAEGLFFDFFLPYVQ